MLTTHSGHSGVISDELREYPAIVRRALGVWLPMDWATEGVRAMIPDGVQAPVYTYVRRKVGVNEFATVVALPIEGCASAPGPQSPGGWDVYNCVKKRHETLPVRNGMPEPGALELLCLAHRYRFTVEELNARAGRVLSSENLRNLPESLRALIYQKGEGYCDAYREEPIEGRVPGLLEPTMITWETGNIPGRPVYYHRLPDGKTFVRIFPALSFTHVQYLSSVVNWPHRDQVRAFGDSPSPGSTYPCRVLWTMTSQGCPVGHAYILKQ